MLYRIYDFFRYFVIFEKMEVFNLNNNAEISSSIIEKRKRFLKRYRKQQALIYRLKLKLKNYEDRLTALNSPTLSDLPKGGVPVTKEEILAEKLETEDRIKRLSDKGAQIRAEIIEKIDELESVRQAEILEAFCLDCKEFIEIAEDIGYSERRVIQIYSEAIERIDIQ